MLVCKETILVFFIWYLNIAPLKLNALILHYCLNLISLNYVNFHIIN